MYLIRASDDLGEITKILRYRAIQPDSSLIKTIDPVRVAPRMALDLGPSDMALHWVVRDVKDVILGRHSLPIFHGCPEGEQSGCNDLVLFRDHIDICVAYVEVGTHHLPPNIRVDDQK